MNGNFKYTGQYQKKSLETEYNYGGNMEFNIILNRINELAKLKKKRELTTDEKIERDELRREYLNIFKSNFKSQLDNIEIVDNSSFSVDIKCKYNTIFCETLIDKEQIN